MKCHICGKDFVPRNRQQKYCSKDCAMESARRRGRLGKKFCDTLPNDYGLRRLDGEKICMWCGNETAPQQHFCSEMCAMHFYSQLFQRLKT